MVHGLETMRRMQNKAASVNKDNFGCVGATIRIGSGEYFDFLNPDPKLITIGTIARPLSRICRFGGHTDAFYSVAEHCVLASMAAEKHGCTDEEQFAILMHDASESLCGDVVKPLKVLLGDVYARIEASIERAIGVAFNIDFEKHHDVIVKFDRAILIVEKHHFFRNDTTKWAGEDTVLKIDDNIDCLPPSYACRQFVERFDQLCARIAYSKGSELN